MRRVTSAQVVSIIIALLSGGLIMAIVALRRSKHENAKIDREAEAIGAKTPAEVESVAITTMTTALTSAQTQVKALEQQAVDRESRHAVERAEWYSERSALRGEIDALEARLRAVLDELSALKDRHNLGDVTA